MAYIQPAGKIELMSGVPLTPAQQDTIYFVTRELQSAYFTTKVVKTLTAQSYTRIGPGRCRIAGEAELLNTCNYMRFNNNLPPNSTTRDYYAFITAVDWINPNVVEITFELDDIQTYLFDYTLGECFIERQHAESDGAGYNIEPEGLDVGEYVTNAVDYDANGSTFIAKDSIDYCYLLGVTTTTFKYLETGDPVIDSLFGPQAETGIYSSTRWIAYNIDDISLLHEQLKTMANLEGLPLIDLLRVQSLYIVPWRIFLPTAPEIGTGIILDNTVMGHTMTVVRPTSFWNDRLTGQPGSIVGHYTPQNNKMYTAPYMFFDLCVGEQTFRGRFEDSGGTELLRLAGYVEVHVTGYVADKPYLVASLINYDREGVSSETSIIYSDFPAITINIHGVEGEFISMAIRNLQTFIRGGGLTGSLNNILNGQSDWTIKRGQNTDITPLMAKPSSVTNDVYRPVWKLGVKSRQVHIEKAKEIDQFFSRYGYAQNKVAVPNTNARLHWTYVKTRGCIVLGNIPSQARVAIARAFDNGITWWKDGNSVGDYGTDMINPTL